MPAATALSEVAGPAVDVFGLSHLRAWQNVVASSPDRTALISYHQSANDTSWLSRLTNDKSPLQCTFQDLDRSARRLATTLNRLIPVQRRPIAVLLHNQAEWLLFFWAAAYLHSPLVPINPKSASRKEEVSQMLRTIRPVIIVAADLFIHQELERLLYETSMPDIPVKIIVCAADVLLPAAWQTLADVMQGELTPPDTPIHADPFETAIILFTSGTTSVPKPCAISSAQTANAAFAYQLPRAISSDGRFVSHLPNFHSYGIGWILAFLLVGGSVVLPSNSFEAQASLECIEKYHATHMSLVPTTAQSIISHPRFAHTNISTLRSVDISGAGVLPSVMKCCERQLKIPIGTSYGMTESPTTIVWPVHSGRATRQGMVHSGWPTRGAHVKICQPSTRTVVPRGEAGELHCGGLQIISAYLGAEACSDSFYTDDDGCNWLVSGDQAVMEHDGAIRICGRYKDLIIRGGENISPASIEAYLQQIPGVYMVHVVGTPDELAGEVPVAVVQTAAGTSVSARILKGSVTQTLGAAFAPKYVLDLERDLHMNAFPTTAAGKVRKIELAAIVRDYLQQHQDRQDTTLHESAATIDTLVRIWQSISGNDCLVPLTSIQSFADSLMMMQLSGIVKQELHKDIMVEDFKTCDTIQAQADLIDRKSAYTAAPLLVVRNGPPEVKDVVHLQDDTDAFQAMRTRICASLGQHGLEWHDVEDISPLPDWDAVFAVRSRPQSWNLRWSYHSMVDSARLEAALRQVISAHPSFRSVAIQTQHDVPLLVSMRSNQAWCNAAWTTGHVLQCKEDLHTLFLDNPVLDSAVLGGPMFRVHIASIQNDGTSGMVVIASHAVCDMSMTKLWMDDLVVALSGTLTIVPHISFHDYARAYYAHRHGIEANSGLEYWTQKLKGIGSLPECTFWPPQRTAEFFKGNDTGWRRFDGQNARSHERLSSLEAKREAQAGIRQRLWIEDIATLKSKHNVPVFMLAKAAIAIMNIHMTSSTEALFGTLNAARKWPFSTEYSAAERERYQGNPLDISGCTTEYVLDRIPISATENVVSFMQRVTADEDQNSMFAKTPVLRLIEALRHPLSEDDSRTWLARERDAEAVLTSIRRQSFNWLPTAPTAQGCDQGLQMLHMLTRMDNGLTITGFLADDKHSIMLALTWDAEHLTLLEAQQALDHLGQLVRVMGMASNWDKTVGQIMATCQ